MTELKLRTQPVGSSTMAVQSDEVVATPESGTIAYLLKRYPRLSETFILHEMLALEAQGYKLRVYSMMNPEETVVHPDVQRLNAPVTYLPEVHWRGLRQLLPAQIVLLRRNPRRYFKELGISLRRSDPFAGLRHFVRGGWLALELERHQIPHLHAHFAHGPAATAEAVAGVSDLSFSFTGHAKDIYTTPRADIARRIRRAAFVLTCTGFNRDFLASLVATPEAAKIHRVYHGVDRRRFQPRLSPPASEATAGAPPVILSIGRFVEKKGFPYLLRACAILRDRGLDFRCQIIGGGPLRDTLQELIANLDLKEIVTLEGARNQEELVACYTAATVVTLPCVVLDNGDRDGIPNVLVEAMSIGCPVVSTAISGIPELVQDGANGLLVPPRDAVALADSLERVLRDAPLRRNLGAAASATIAERFDLDANARLVGALLRSTTRVTGAPHNDLTRGE